jgi:competence protein ComFB
MEIHNLMEDLVLKTVDEIFSEEGKKSGESNRMSPQCRLDVACFVLNRVPPHYVSSGRGAAHAEKMFQENSQLTVDVVTLVHEGLKRITHVQRPHYSAGETARPPSGPVFGFPIIKGRLLSCTTFEPVRTASVELLIEGERAAMIDSCWQNPVALDPKIEGTILFLPRPWRAEKTGEERTFECEIFVDDPAYEVFHHFFKMHLASDIESEVLPRKSPDFKLPDLYLVPK